ncbi:MAG TPA: hypothetical protein VJN18_25605 [Polyangiaceae bacterium]|nr:hypothetical protein [Polyangiaceae bacterium]
MLTDAQEATGRARSHRLGLVPSENTTEGRRRVGAISKKGNPTYGRSSCKGAWAVLCKAGGDEPLRLWEEAVAKRRGKRIAVGAVARRMVGILWAMWRDGSVYEPAALRRRSARGVRKNAQDRRCPRA